jgi:hypothetical protein
VSVENRIFWLVVAILAFFLVFTGKGRDVINRFVHAVFGYSPAPSTEAPKTTPSTPVPTRKTPDGRTQWTYPGSGGMWFTVPPSTN